MNLKLEGKNALVCGGSKGIGKAIAMQLAELGANVTLAARSVEIMGEIVSDLADKGGQKHDFLSVDMENTDELIRKIRGLSMQKRIHILINNSGGPPGGPIIEAKEDEFTKALNRHLIANHHLVQLLWPGMKEDGYGRIINIISTSVKEPIPGLGVSNTTRGAVASWAKTMSLELGPYGITVNNILPGFTRTERLGSLIETWANQRGLTIEEMEKEFFKLIPLGRFAEPHEVGEVAAYLATPSASYISGVSLAVDGGRLKGI